MLEKIKKILLHWAFLFELNWHDFFDKKKKRLFLTVLPYTMVSYKRLNNVYKLAEQLERTGIEGSFVECGVWRGGCIAVMAQVAQKHNSKRKICLFDSFKGLPEPIGQDGEKAINYSFQKSSGRLKPVGQCVASVKDVEEIIFEKLKIDKDDVLIFHGWFQDTLPQAKEQIGSIAILRLDGDWYESTKVCLKYLFDKVVSGGYVIIDDYGHWEGCRKAIDEFLRSRQLNVNFEKIDYTGVYFKKP